MNGELVGRPSVVISELARDFDLGKALRSIQRLQPAHIASQQRLAVSAMREQAAACRLHLHAGTEVLFIKVLGSRGRKRVNFNRYFCQSMARTRVNHVDHTKTVMISFRRLSLDGHLGLEKPAGLQIIQQVAASLVEQIVVECVLLVNRYVLLDQAASKMKSFHRHLDHGTGIDIDGVIY